MVTEQAIKSVSLESSMGWISRVHMVGIGGAGMLGIAEVLLNQGYQVSGSDLKSSPAIRRLEKLGIKVSIGHLVDAVLTADVVVASAAIAQDNPELLAARAQRIPVVMRAEMLAELMRFRHGIAVAGSHGKTTTTSLLANVFEVAGMDPTFVIGGMVKSIGSHAKLGASRYMVAEVDESDASFLLLHPLTAVVTNLDLEHMSTFSGRRDLLDEAFLQFLHNLPFYGLAVLCGDDPGVRRILPKVSRKFMTYGFGEDNDIRALDYKSSLDGCAFSVVRPGASVPLEVKLPLMGRHNVLNALATITVAMDEGIDDAPMVKALATFSGVERRCEFHANVMVAGQQVDLIDDYGHHPTELAVVIESLRELYPQRRILMVFQLHRYSRTKDHYDDFAAVLSQVDVLIMPDVYAAGETPIPGADAHSLCMSIRQRGNLNPMFAKDMDVAFDLVKKVVNRGDLVVTQGAGEISMLKKRMLENDTEPQSNGVKNNA